MKRGHTHPSFRMKSVHIPGEGEEVKVQTNLNLTSEVAAIEKLYPEKRLLERYRNRGECHMESHKEIFRVCMYLGVPAS